MASDNPSALCSRFFKDMRNDWGESVKGAKFVKEFSFQGRCTGYFDHDLWGGANPSWISATVNIVKMKKSEYNSAGECQENGLAQLSNSSGKFSVVCTYKHKPKEEKPTVGSTSNSSNNSSSSDSSSPNSSSAGGGGGGGGSSASHATTPDGGMQGGGTTAGSGQGGTAGGSGQGGSSGQGDSGGQDYELPETPESPFGKGDGEPNWGSLKSNGDFGTFKPSSDFATGGQCPQDILLDFGQFGSHSFSWSPVCESAQRLRYVFITLAYFMSAMMVFRTVNSLKG